MILKVQIFAVIIHFMFNSSCLAIEISTDTFTQIVNSRVLSQYSSLLSGVTSASRRIKCLNQCRNFQNRSLCNVVTFDSSSKTNNCFFYYMNSTLKYSNFTVLSSTSSVFVKKEAIGFKFIRLIALIFKSIRLFEKNHDKKSNFKNF